MVSPPVGPGEAPAPAPTSHHLPPRPRISRTARRRAIYALAAVVAAEVVGTVGFHVIEGAGWVNAFYFESMLATGQGPPFQLNTDTGKIFASIMAFVSVGSVISALVFSIGPIVARYWRESLEHIEADVHRIEHGATAELRRLEEEIHRHHEDGHGSPPKG